MSRPIPLPQAPSALVECTQCAKCCTYVGVGINEPTSLRYATDVLWYLYHENVSVHVDGDGEWMVVFETRCRQLGHDLLCGVYEQRPLICRDFDNRTCEVNAPRRGRTFTAPEEFLEWLSRRRPSLHRRLRERFVPRS
jgi:Fe-S-cluster containining protein